MDSRYSPHGGRLVVSRHKDGLILTCVGGDIRFEDITNAKENAMPEPKHCINCGRKLKEGESYECVECEYHEKRYDEEDDDG